EPSVSFSAPPFSVTRSRPSGRKAMAVGWLNPPRKTVSSKPAAGFPAHAGDVTARVPSRRRVRARMDMGRLLIPPHPTFATPKETVEDDITCITRPGPLRSADIDVPGHAGQGACARGTTRRPRDPRGRARGAFRALGRQGGPEREQGRHLRRAPDSAQRPGREVSGARAAGHDPLPRPAAPRRCARRPPPGRGQRPPAGDRPHPASEAPPLAPGEGEGACRQARPGGEEEHAPKSRRGGLTVRRAALCVVFALGPACAGVRPRVQGVHALTTVTDAQQPGTVGERVRWGGEIVSTTPATGDTCFEIVSKPLNRDARPVPADESAGRFVACSPGFFDPTIYAPGREVTVVGTVEPPTPGKVGDADYSFSRVHTDTVFLWPQRPPRDL